MIGLVMGPTAVALCTEKVFHRDDALNHSLLIVTVLACALAAVLLWSGLKPFLRSLERLTQWVAAERA
jgi:hypothetical protein